MPKVKSPPIFGGIAAINREIDVITVQAERNGLRQVRHHNSGCEGCSYVIRGGWPTGLSCSLRVAAGYYMVVPANYACSHWS